MASLAEQVIQYETSGLDEVSEAELFQRMVNDGTAWRLQGSYGRRAMELIEAGIIAANHSGPVRDFTFAGGN